MQEKFEEVEVEVLNSDINKNYSKIQLTNEIKRQLENFKDMQYIIDEINSVAINIRYVDDEVPRLKHIEKGDWIDVYAWEEVELKQGELKPIKLGFALQLPDGWEAHLAPRSSTCMKFGILCANSFGVIDNSYAGDNDIWGFLAYAIRDTTIHKGDRIAQFRVVEKQPKIIFREVDHLEKPDRGGFGSTGNGVL